MVRDPLVLDPTPWDLLELPASLLETIREQVRSEHGLGGRELTTRVDREFRTALDRAYTRALKNRVPPQRAKGARDTLLRPTGRARIELLRFPHDAFARLAGERGAAVLEPVVRGETARAWEAHFADHIDDLPAAHCLAILWWGWVHWEEERLRLLAAAGGPRGTASHQASPSKLELIELAHRASGAALTGADGRCCARADCPWLLDFRSSAPDLFAMWCALIEYIGLLSTERAFVAARFDLAAADAEAVLDSLVETLKSELLDRAQALGSSVEGKRYRLLEQFLAEEVHTARVLGAARLTLGGVERAPGPRLLARLGLTDVADDARRKPAQGAHGPAAAAALKVSLSPYAVLERQARDGKPEQALEALSMLPPHEQETPAMDRARAAALSVIALKQAADGKLTQALATWGRARPGSLAPEIETDIVRLVRARFEELSKGRLERNALDLLREALKVLPGSTALQSLISAERHDQAVRSVARIRERLDRRRAGLTDMRTLSGLIEELELSIDLGFEDARASLEWARVALEIHSIGGQSNRLARARLDHELARWCDRTHRPKLRISLQELLSEFRAAMSLGSRSARANADTVEQLLHRLNAPPGELPALALAGLARLEAERTPGGLETGDLARLEGLLFDLEAGVARSVPDAVAAAAKIRPLVVALLAARAREVLDQGLAEPLRNALGLRPVTANRELKALLAAHEDLKRALALDPGQDALRSVQADVREALVRANRAPPAGDAASATFRARALRRPITVLLVLGALILFLIWLVKSLWRGVRPVH